MVYGTPPLETVATNRSIRLSSSTHGIFERFQANLRSSSTLGVSTTPSSFPDHHSDRAVAQYNWLGALYFVPFTIDVVNLAPNYSIHFDLYDLGSGDLRTQSKLRAW